MLHPEPPVHPDRSQAAQSPTAAAPVPPPQMSSPGPPPQNAMSSITAQFTPRSTNHSRRSTALINVTSPVVAGSLLRLFPFIIITNNILDFYTWTVRDPVLNLLYHIMGYLLIYYNNAAYWLGPLILVTCYCAVNYYVNSVYIDTSGDTPTLEEVVDTLENLTIRFDILLAPIRSVDYSRWKLFNVLFLLTPFHILALKYMLRPKVYVLIWAVIITTFHSLWFQATIKILWRSQMVRNTFHFFIGTPATSLFSDNYKILNESILPENKTGKIIQFQIFEHERRWVGIGWCNKLLPYERANYTNEALQASASPREFKFPFNSKHWQWLEEDWNVDADYCKRRNKEGWLYYDNYWQNPQLEDSITAYTRSRKWTRKAVLVTDHKK